MLPQADIGDAAAAALAHVEDPHLVDYVRIVYKKRWLVAITFLLVLAGAAAYLHRATPQYEATVELFIGPDGGNAARFSENEPPEQGKVDYYQTQYKLLESRELAKQTIDALKLWEGAEVTQPANSEPQWLSDLKARLIDLEARITGSEPRIHDPEESSGADKAAGPDGSVETRKVQTFLSHLRVEPVRNSRLVDVSFRSPDPTVAATVANALADAYIQRNLQFRTATSKEASGWLQGQLEEQRQKVEQSDAAVQRYLEQNDGVTLDQRQDIVLQKLMDVNSSVTKAKTDRIEKESMFRQIESAKGSPDALNTFPSILANTVIQEERGEIAKLQSQLRLLSEKLGDRHPDIIKTKAALQMAEDRERGEIEKVVQSVRADYENAAARERGLLDALGQQKSESLRQGRKGMEFAVLQREAEGNRQLYNNLLQRSKEAGISADVSTSSIRVVDRADVPLHPVSPKRTMTLLLALFGGAFGSLGLAFFIEYFDPRLKTPDDVRGHLRLTSLGLVPRARGWRLPKNLLINGRVPPEFAEAFKTIRTNLLFGSSVQGGRSILVTSTRPGEGKSLVTVNLGIAMAAAGCRVVVIDADLRRPKVHELLGITQEPGFTDVIARKQKLASCLRTTSIPRLSVLPAGHMVEQPSELLGMTRCIQVLDVLKAHFDWILIDTPPTIAVADALTLAHAVTGVVFVVGADMTSRHHARAALDQLERARARFAGAVLNRIKLDAHPFYYARYYRRKYSRYYAQGSS